MLKEDYIKETAGVLEMIAYQIADLTRVKEELEKRLAATLEHGEEGQKTYVEGRYKITVKTGVNYTLDKEEYESIGKRLPAQFDPVTKVVKYELNKKVIREAYVYGSNEDKEILDAILSTKPAKLSVTIGSAS